MFENWDFRSPLAFKPCKTMRTVFQYDMWCKKGGANLWLSYQFSSINVYCNVGNNFVSVKSWEHYFQTYLMVWIAKYFWCCEETTLISSQGLALLGFFAYALSETDLRVERGARAPLVFAITCFLQSLWRTINYVIWSWTDH